MLTRFWWMVDRNPLSQARGYLALWMLAALERVSYGICRRMGWGHTTLCARSYDLQGEYSFWAIFRRVADACHPEKDHCAQSSRRHSK